MKPVTVLASADAVARFATSDIVGAALVQVPPGGALPPRADLPLRALETEAPFGSEGVLAVLDALETPWLLQVVGDADPHPRALQRLVQVSTDAAAALVYGDYFDATPAGPRLHVLADHQPGSLEDRFDLGPFRLWSRDLLRLAMARHGRPLGLRWHAWYDLRLKVLEAGVLRVPEPLGVLRPQDVRKTGQQVFDYLLASRESALEAERVATAHLARVGARVGPAYRDFVPSGDFPVEASVVIPVRNRVRTVLDAVDSALGQRAPFDFNVIVVNNHSTDGTTEALADRAAREPRLVHVRVTRPDLGIGGCWNEAVHHPAAGRWVVQLDSDDLYAGPDTLARMVDLLRRERCGMAVGSYTLVDFDLAEIPPGLVDHREWTPDNGPNNALRIGGLGAPRAFATELVRRHPFPNASYGEDYAVALRISREYRVGRIFESVYFCRRWEDNSDADLPPEVKARYQAYKDRIRTLEIEARRRVRS